MFAYQFRLRIAPPQVLGHKDYRIKAQLYKTIDDILTRSKLDDLFIEHALKNRDALRKEMLADKLKCDAKELDGFDLSADDFTRARFIEHSLVAFRCNIIRFLDGNGSVRDLSSQLAESHLVQWFCHVENFGVINPPSKSTVDRYFRWIPSEDLDQLIAVLLRQAPLGAAVGEEVQALGLESALDFADLWIDNTCLKANIHFPVDWVLLVDGVRTLMKATTLIRGKGELKNRMPQSPEKFLRKMNALAIAMSQVRRQPDSKKKRKKILREMKKLEQKIRRHALKHQELLRQHWEQTPWTEKQAMRIVERIQSVVDQLPQAVKQAHDRIIGGRKLKSSEKILSLYEPDINVIVRGKAGAEFEIGNVLAIGEQADGLIVSWKLYKANIPDTRTSISNVTQAQEVTENRIKAVYGDRGTSSAANSKELEKMGVRDHLGPKAIDAFRKKMQGEAFAAGQKRRAQTEGRIGIVKNCFLGGNLRAKGIENRKQAVSWAVLSHNLWVLARLRIRQEEERKRRNEQARAEDELRKQAA